MREAGRCKIEKMRKKKERTHAPLAPSPAAGVLPAGSPFFFPTSQLAQLQRGDRPRGASRVTSAGMNNGTRVIKTPTNCPGEQKCSHIRGLGVWFSRAGRGIPFLALASGFIQKKAKGGDSNPGLRKLTMVTQSRGSVWLSIHSRDKNKVKVGAHDLKNKLHETFF